MSIYSEDTYEGAERLDPVKKTDKAKRRRQVQVLVRLSEAEAERLRQIQDSATLSASGIFRRWINDQPLPNRSTEKLIGELRRQGGLLKHAAFGAGNQGAISGGNMEHMLALAEEIARIARGIESGGIHDHDTTDS